MHLVNAQVEEIQREACGPIIGSFLDHPIFAWIVRQGRRYAYDHVVLWKSGKAFPVLRGQIFIEPGILYRETF